MPEHKDYYATLGVSRSAGDKDIKQAYRRLAVKLHPDKNPSESKQGFASSQFQDVNEAYHTLVDRKKRDAYNKQLLERQSGATESHSYEVNQAEMVYRQGVKAYNEQNFKRAVEYFKAAVRLNPKKAAYYDRLGIAVVKAGGSIEDARAQCEKAQQMEMYNPEHYLSMGIIYQLAGLREKAKEQFKEALKWDPNNAAAKQRLVQIAKEKKGFFGKMFGG